MAAISINPLCHCKQKPIIFHGGRRDSRALTIACCQNGDPPERKTGKERREDKGLTMLRKLLVGMEKVGRRVEENWSPKRKGDWKDITLMSLSFAVYVYMSQQIVCAYCAWMSMPRQPW